VTIRSKQNFCRGIVKPKLAVAPCFWMGEYVAAMVRFSLNFSFQDFTNFAPSSGSVLRAFTT
jgi:hypothetical protein